MSSEFLSHVSFASPRALISVGVVFPALSLIAVTFRFYTRHVQKTSLLMDDWLTLPALVSHHSFFAVMSVVNGPPVILNRS